MGGNSSFFFKLESGVVRQRQGTLPVSVGTHLVCSHLTTLFLLTGCVAKLQLALVAVAEAVPCFLLLPPILDAAPDIVVKNICKYFLQTNQRTCSCCVQLVLTPQHLLPKKKIVSYFFPGMNILYNSIYIPFS